VQSLLLVILLLAVTHVTIVCTQHLWINTLVPVPSGPCPPGLGMMMNSCRRAVVLTRQAPLCEPKTARVRCALPHSRQ
jgi:hypothetical protein